ncbi:uncharacterized protein F4812DRAFT_461468 [Daldinia caldariorum]|uniref:uncharacterized protein n=1 Tax=Daldinia caldariorum TaxID=326644 RepID=UPI00200862C7|nr:uncharacterized protein F4812DRAFT_461468 [Daldinia caldariorum]KAI1465780.1 hypothetical protein F4812DRAFT_461468 [Daldinia caldariorum]
MKRLIGGISLAKADWQQQTFRAGAHQAAFPKHGSQPRTRPKCEVPAAGYARFGSNYARLAVQEMRMGRSKNGFLLQAVAGAVRRKSPEQLRDMAERVGRERIMVLHGTADRMIPVGHSRKLIEYINPGKALVKEGLGHTPIQQTTRWFNELLEERDVPLVRG